MNTLIIAAHPDDEVLGCGGTIVRMVREDHNVYIAILGEGITSRYHHREEADATLLADLKEKAKRVGEFLGAQKVFNYDLPDNRFDTVPMLDIVKLIENLIERIQPEIIYTHHNGDLNIDHCQVFRATLTAARMIHGSFVKKIYSYEVPSSTEWSLGRFYPIFQPNVFVDIRDTLANKIQAMALYDSEGRLFPHPRSPEAIKATAIRWGCVSGCYAAEAFELIRAVR
jgi:LmbE family N-acetylglucosaminyl deacetylase